MKFTTRVPIAQSRFPIDYNSKIVSLGSCFAVNIAEKFEYYQFRHTVNPLGILFSPIAIEKLIKRAIGKERFAQGDIFYHNDHWHSFDAHSECSSPDKAHLLEKLNASVDFTREAIGTATHVFITLGTAWVYRHIESQQFVANCHKVPQTKFVKELLGVREIAESLDAVISMIATSSPKISIVFTISPVRHLKDGFVENQQSKANLISALHPTLRKHANAAYFPSYEIVMDELRDYRFYAADMLHPNQTAIDYIWERFTESWIARPATATMEEVSLVRKALAHRPFDVESAQHQTFVAATRAKIDRLTAAFPHMDFQGRQSFGF